MLGESFIHLLKYREDDVRTQNTTRSSSIDSIHDSFTIASIKEKSVSGKCESPDMKHVMKQSGSRAPHPSPDLYFSKTSVSWKQNLASSKVLTDNCPDMICESSFEIPELHIHSMDESSPQQLRSINQQLQVPDDGYLVMDNSIMLNGEPPTNSMINGYLDRKLQEVYSQYLQERLTCPGASPGCSLLPLIPQPSVFDLESSLDSETRPSQVHRNFITSQGHLSQRASSNFSSPVLRISNTEQPKMPPDCL